MNARHCACPAACAMHARPRNREAEKLSARLALRDELLQVAAADLVACRDRIGWLERALASAEQDLRVCGGRLRQVEGELRAARTFVRRGLVTVLARRAGR